MKLKIKSILLPLLLTGTVFAGIRSWQPVLFSVPSDSLNEIFQAMRSEQDSVLQAIESDNPEFQNKFSQGFSRFLTNALNSIAIPHNLIQYLKVPMENDQGLEVASYAIGKNIQSIEIYTFESFIRPLTNPEKPQNFVYKYCEKHPEISNWPCYEGSWDGYGHNDGFYNDSREYIFIRRLLSHPKFVEKICPVITPFAKWYFNWGWWPGVSSAADKTKALRPLFFRMHQLLDHIYADGQWNHENIVESYEGFEDLDPSLVSSVGRRYLDGGPQLMLAYRGCLTQVEASLPQYQITPTSEAAIEINKILKFEKDPRSHIEWAHLQPQASDGQAWDPYDPHVSVKYLERLFRLSHFWPGHEALPPELDWLTETEEDHYLNPLTEVSWRATNNSLAMDIAARLNEVDPIFQYRILTTKEYQQMSEENQKEMKEGPSFCLINRDVFQSSPSSPLVLSVFDRHDNQFSETKEIRGYECSWGLKLVREPRTTKKAL